MAFTSETVLSNVSNVSDIANYSETGTNDETFNPIDAPTYVLMRRMQTVLLPIICVFGIIGNVLAAGAFISPTLRGTSCCLYLATKTISDIGFLLSLFIVWLYRVKVSLLNIDGICQLTIFLSYVCGFLSVWLVVVITFENFIRISKPWRIPVLCSHRKAIMTIISLLLFTCVLYSFPLWTIGIHPKQELKCRSFDKYITVVHAMTYVDTCLTLILPSICMFFLVLAIMFSALQAYKRKLRLRGVAQNGTAKMSSRTPEGRVSRFLFAVSIIFLFLHTPSHVIRMKIVILQYFYNQTPSLTDLVFQRVFETFYYLNFSLNCVIYLLFGENMRRVFLQMYFSKCRAKHMADVQESNNLSPLVQPGWSYTEASCVDTST